MYDRDGLIGDRTHYLGFIHPNVLVKNADLMKMCVILRTFSGNFSKVSFTYKIIN